MSELKALLAPVSRFVATLDLTDAAGAERELSKQFPEGSAALAEIRSAAERALAEGAICDRGEPDLKFSRVIKPQDDAAGCSVDAVYMADSAGRVHTHTKGEVCLCFAQGGAPRFEDRTDTWIVMPAGSRHVPTVEGGAMLILYWWPEGAVAWS